MESAVQIDIFIVAMVYRKVHTFVRGASLLAWLAGIVSTCYHVSAGFGDPELSRGIGRVAAKHN